MTSTPIDFKVTRLKVKGITILDTERYQSTQYLENYLRQTVETGIPPLT